MKNSIAQTCKAVAANIKLARLNKNYKQEYVASRLNLSQNAYSKIELGHTGITLNKLFTLAHIFEVGVLDLLGKEYLSLDVNHPPAYQTDLIISS